MLEIGSVIDGKYKILNVVGKGGMSIVYLAMNERANKQWAVKEIRKDGSQNYEVVKQNLVAETDMLKRLHHPNLPSIIDVIDNGDTFLIVMDYIEGISLNDILDNGGAQTQEDVIDWAKQLCDVLGYLHSRQPPIVYRDMKPANVMLKPDGNVMLIDFGTAREFKDHSVADTTCLGTQGYAAPEQFGGQGQTDGRTDIYCLGATMYHLVTGHNPCKAPYEMYPIRQWNPQLSSGLEEIILTCTQRNPNDRYQSCEELRYALDHFTDLDIETKKVQTLKWRMFLVSAILAVVMLFGSVAFGVAASIQTRSTYDNIIEQSKKRGSSDGLSDALSLEPSRSEAYEQLLAVYIDDQLFTAKEFSELDQLTDGKLESFKKTSKSKYAEKFAYPLAEALYFMYENNNEGINKSAYWFNEAREYGNDAAITERAELLFKMASYHSGIGQIDKTGKQQVSYSDYWKDLKKMASDSLADEDNITVALSVYKAFVNELYNRAEKFDFLTQAEADAELNRISAALDRIERKGAYDQRLYGDTMSGIRDRLVKAREAVTVVLNNGKVGVQ